MGRRRLLAVLTAMVVATGLHVVPASAQTVGLPGLGEVKVDTSDGVKVGVDLDVELTDDAKLDPEVGVGVGKDGPEVDVGGGVAVGERKVDLGRSKAPEPSPKPSPSPESPPPPSPRDTDRGERPRADEGAAAAAGPGSKADGGRVVAAGDAEGWTPRRAAQFEAFRAIRGQDVDLGVAGGSAVLPGVELAPRRAQAPGSAHDTGHPFDAPEIAPGLAPGVTAAGPDAATGATLAASPVAGGPVAQVPLALQVLTGMLVAGTALAWHVTRRELGWALSGLRRVR
ncbi:hypothetical protein [Egicoccus sp. AB-alg2]|uniref:hypothetical protein n=1 Tax=Egicoccus sp. AB-alg2 TaxID=3242693 RepID=UPI00359E7761